MKKFLKRALNLILEELHYIFLIGLILFLFTYSISTKEKDGAQIIKIIVPKGQKVLHISWEENYVDVVTQDSLGQYIIRKGLKMKKGNVLEITER